MTSSRTPTTRSLHSTTSTTTTHPTIILEIGSSYLRLGFSNEKHPHRIIPSPLLPPLYNNSSSPPLSTSLWISHLLPLLESCFWDHLLLTNPRQRRVIVILPTILPPMAFQEAITTILIETINVKSLLFCNSCVTSLYALGLTCGIVLDMGRREARSGACLGGVMIPNTWHAVPAGFDDVVDVMMERWGEEVGGDRERMIPMREDGCEIMSLVLMDGGWWSRDGAREERESGGEMISCLIPSEGRVVDIPLRIFEDAWEEVVFDSYNPRSLVYAVLSTLLGCPIDLRRTLYQNFVVVGGGMASYPIPTFVEKLETAARDNDKFEPLRPLFTIKPREYRFAKDLVSWMGGSIIGTMTLEKERWVTREEWSKGDKSVIYDWSSVA